MSTETVSAVSKQPEAISSDRPSEIHGGIHDIRLNLVSGSGTVKPMEHLIDSDTFRQRPSDCVARAARGEVFIVCSYGRPVALLGPRTGDDPSLRLSATALWRESRRSLAIARRRPVLITWRGQAVAVLRPVPPDVEWEWAS
jgi:antitoxin (DNA-binding transcriptional repressor) of toxin-antitoxin stability system